MTTETAIVSVLAVWLVFGLIIISAICFAIWALLSFVAKPLITFWHEEKKRCHVSAPSEQIKALVAEATRNELIRQRQI